MATAQPRISIGPIVGLMVGMAAIIGLFVWYGLEDVYKSISHAGWGLLLLCLLDPPNQLISALGWRALFPPRRRPPVMPTLWASWIGDAVNLLLPVATVGGEIVKARVLSFRSSSTVDAYSTMMVDKTVQAITILLWALIGIVMLVLMVPNNGVIIWACLGALLFSLGIGGFVALQLFGSFSYFARLVARIIGPERLQHLTGGAQEFDAAVRAIYRRPKDVAIACAYLMIRQLWLVTDIMLAAYLMGQPIGLGEAILLKALVTAIVAFSFAIPAGLGFQEGGFIAVGALLGYPPELMLALSLASRVREVLPAIPFLIHWQHLEGRALFRRHLAQIKAARKDSGAVIRP